MANIENLLVEAASDGEVSRHTTALLTDAATLTQIKKGDGVSASEYRESEALIVTLLVDDSGSIFDRGNDGAVRDGFNAIIEALKGTKQRGRILMSCRYLNGTVLCPYEYLEKAPLMSDRNFRNGGGTPLYDQTLVTIGSVMAKAKEFDDAGINHRTWTLVISDGADEHSRRVRAADVAELIKTLNSEVHVVLAIGVSDGKTDFRQVFCQMGIKEDKIMVSTDDPKAIRATFRLASQSAVAMNQPNPAGGLGGFGG